MHRNSVLAILAVIGLVAVIVWGRRQPAEYLRIEGAAQGTAYHIVWESKNGANLKPEIESLLRELDHSLSTYATDSIITGINKNDPAVVPDEHVLNVLADAIRVHKDTGGAFDPTIAPVVRASGFGPGAATDIDEESIKTALRLVGVHQVTIADGHIIKKQPGITFDLNGIAQGYSVDVVSHFLEARGIANFMVEIGGEVFAQGVNAEGKDWRVGIDRPSEGNLFPGSSLQAIIALHDQALATSGNYRSYHQSNGRKYTHCIDPRTGRPTESSLLSVTVTAPTCALADAYATACMVMGLEESIAFVQSRPELDALFIHSDDSGALQTHATPGLPEIER